MILSLALIVSSFVNSVPAQQTYAATSDTSVLYYNTGHRDTDAHALSNNAIAYYDDFAYDYAKLRSGEVTVSATNLATSLNGLMRTTLENQVPYGDLPKYWAYTDAEDSTAGTIYFYADKSDADVSGEELNREHVWPKSHASFYQLYGGADLHHLRPAIKEFNSFRSSYTMGEIDEKTAQAGYYFSTVGGYLKNNTFEPLENVKFTPVDQRGPATLMATVWPEPNAYGKTDPSLMTSEHFDVSQEGLEEAVQWINDQYSSRLGEWNR